MDMTQEELGKQKLGRTFTLKVGKLPPRKILNRELADIARDKTPRSPDEAQADFEIARRLVEAGARIINPAAGTNLLTDAVLNKKYDLAALLVEAAPAGLLDHPDAEGYRAGDYMLENDGDKWEKLSRRAADRSLDWTAAVTSRKPSGPGVVK